MIKIVRNILGVIFGVVIGSTVNMFLINISGSIIPPPEGADIRTMGEMKFFPNPTTDMIQVLGIDNAQYEIYSIDGSMEKAGNVNGALINVNDLQLGSYLINLRDEESILQAKMVKI